MSRLNHIGIIMDGNGRWAIKQGLKRMLGHDQGVKTFENVLRWCIEYKIPYLSVFGFSTENWTRSTEEVNHLMYLLKKYIRLKKQNMIDKGICLKIIGNPRVLDVESIAIIKEINEKTKSNRSITVQLGFDYGGKDEIVRASRKLYNHIGHDKTYEITEGSFSKYLDTYGTPDVDLLIRTGKVRRLSNFMIWQTTYAELYFSDKLWPEFDRAELELAIEYYHNAERRFGNA